MISRIEARRYRCLENIGVDLPRYSVLVGANGAGKTTLLDIPRLLSDCLKERDITQAFLQRQNERPARCTNLRELVFCERGNDFSFAIEACIPDVVIQALVLSSKNAGKVIDSDALPSTIRYELRLEISDGRQIKVRNEYLYTYADKNIPPHDGAGIYGEYAHQNWCMLLAREYGNDTRFAPEVAKGKKRQPKNVDVDSSMLALPRIIYESRDEYMSAIWFHDLLAKQYLFYQPDLTALQAASAPGASDVLLPDATNLPWMVFNLKKDENRFKLWQEHVKTALPNIESIDVVEREEDHHCYFRIHYNGSYAVTSSGLSEGTLRIFAMTILPYISNLPDIVFLEEPENGIHPQAIESVLQSLSSTYKSQLFLSTHSPVTLANVNLDNILCARLNNEGAVDIVLGRNHPQLKDWKGGLDLGSLFAAGVFG